MASGEYLYPAQKYFPEQCLECPTLLGLIEDGYLLGSVTEAQVKRELINSDMYDIERCSGPFDTVYPGTYDRETECTTAILNQLEDR